MKKPRRRNRELGSIWRWGLLISSMQVDGGGVGDWGDECSVKGELEVIRSVFCRSLSTVQGFPIMLLLIISGIIPVSHA